MLLKNKAEYAIDPKEVLFLEAMPDISKLDNIPSPRPLNTHVPYRWLPKQHIENGGKIVHVLRNPKDVAVSYYHVARNSTAFGEHSDFKSFYEKIYMGSGNVRSFSTHCSLSAHLYTYVYCCIYMHVH
jgi:hypothetical protein